MINIKFKQLAWKNLIAGLKHQMTFKRLFRNYFITGNGLGLFDIRSHINENAKEKVKYNTLESATKASIAMEKKYGNHYSIYKCIYCDGYHIGKNKDNKNTTNEN